MAKRLSKEEKVELRKEIGGRLRSIREASGFSIRELAECLDLTPGFIGLIEKGERGLSAELLINISSIFNCSADYLLTGAQNASATNPHSKSNQTTEIDLLLNAQSRKKLADFIRSFSHQQHAVK